ncbi:MAG: hypothetical protein LBQ69_05890, partial [Treponema sp.]|nr:hypothetical protein [Treponema sp.]
METMRQTEHPTFESVWAMMQENERKWEETRKERELEWKEIAKMQKENNRQIGKLGNRLGEMVECMVKSNLTEKFRELGFE